jgi:hypothetical protein
VVLCDAGRIFWTYPGMEAAEVHDYHDVGTGVLAATVVGRAPGYTSLGFPDPRRMTPAPAPDLHRSPRARVSRPVPAETTET